MSKPPERRLTQAQMEVELAKQKLASTMGALKYRLAPGTIMTSTWEGVRGKGSELAEDAIQAVKDRPMTASGVLAAFCIFLARDPLWSMLSGWLRGGGGEDLVTTRLDETDDNYDLTAPAVERSVVNEGVNA